MIFGDKWEIKHGTKPSGEWANVFMSFDERGIVSGIDRMRLHAEEKIKAGDEAWPPIPFEFACFCKTKSSLYFPDGQKSLPPPRPDRIFANEQIKIIREKIGKSI